MKRVMSFLFPLITLISCAEEEINEILEPDLEINTEKTVYVIAGSPSDDMPYQIVKTAVDSLVTVIDDPAHNYWGLRLSPDKTKFLCFKSAYDGTQDKGYDEITEAELWLYNIDGTGGEMLTDLTSNGFYSMGYASWHPGGNQIVFAASKGDIADGENQLYIFSLSDGSIKRISAREVTYSRPCFSPDGSLITYIAYANGSDQDNEDFEIYYADYDAAAVEMSDENKITDNDTEDKFPGFSGDGKYISYNYTYFVSTNVDRIFLYDIASATTIDLGEKQDKYSTKNALWSDADEFYYEENITGKLNTYIRRINIETLSEIKVVRDLNAVLNFREAQEL
jgi:Tol biopolymer transport system component